MVPKKYRFNQSISDSLRAIQVLRNTDGGGGVKFYGKKCYKGVRFNVISITREWVGSNFQKKSVR